jgi:hypothetical protein
MIDDLVAELLYLADWTDADSSLDTSYDYTGLNNDGEWRKRARVLRHDPSGRHLLIYETPNPTGQYDGRHIRMAVCEGWDSNNSIPSGKTALVDGGEIANDYENVNDVNDTPWQDRSTSFADVGAGTSQGLRVANNGGEKYEITYQLSVGTWGITAAAWNTNDSSNGLAAGYVFDPKDRPLWDDGIPGWTEWSFTTHDQGTSIHKYDFEYVSDNKSYTPDEQPAGGGLAQQAYGLVNNDDTDDTVFVRPANIHRSRSRDVPVAEFANVLPNRPADGASHGDSVTWEGSNYRVVAQSGASVNEEHALSAMLRFE